MKPKPIGTIIARVRERQARAEVILADKRTKEHEREWLRKHDEAKARWEQGREAWRALPWWRRLRRLLRTP